MRSLWQLPMHHLAEFIAENSTWTAPEKKDEPLGFYACKLELYITSAAYTLPQVSPGSEAA